MKGYGDVISPGSTIVHDGDNSHNVLVRILNLKEEVHTTKETKGLPDKDNPMDPINKVHRYLSGFIDAHSIFSRDELQSWLNLFCFYWNNSGNEFQKAQKFIELAAKKRIKLRYRKLKKR